MSTITSRGLGATFVELVERRWRWLAVAGFAIVAYWAYCVIASQSIAGMAWLPALLFSW